MSRNRCRTTCDCGLDFSYRPEIGERPPSALIEGPEYLRQIGWEDCPYNTDGWHEKGATLFAKVICPLCLTEFVGWFCPPDMPQWDGPEWRIYDTSYWSSYNDEPDEEDKRNRRDPAEVLASLKKLSDHQSTKR
jgi:hypothetical protein